MTEDHISSTPPQPHTTGIQESPPVHAPEVVVQPPAGPKLTWQLIFANLGVQLIIALLVGVITLITLNTMGSENATARGGAIVAALIGLWAARSLVHWPISKEILKAQAQ